MCVSKFVVGVGCALFAVASLPVSINAKGHARGHSSSSSSSSEIVPIDCKSKHKSDKVSIFDHQIQLQLADAYGIPVPGTQFWVTLTIRKEGPFVTVQLPAINFETGPMSGNPCEEGVPVFVPGGYVYTTDGFLPCDLRPNDIITRSYFGPCNNGANLAFSYYQEELPSPIAGYLLQFTNAGGLTIQGAGTFGNIIPPGQQNLLPTTISYIVESPLRLKHNKALSAKFTNVAKLPVATGPTPYANGLRDQSVNDAFNGRAAWVWSDNSNVADQTQAVTNIAVAVGKVNKKGELKVSKPHFLTNYTAGSPTGSMNFDRAVAINRTNPDNIVVSWSVSVYPENDADFTAGFNVRAVSFDGGKTWPAEYNGTSGLPPVTGFPIAGPGDTRGVASDKYGNFWFSSTNLFDDSGNFLNLPYFALSTDGGITFETVYTFPTFGTPTPTSFYDYPEFCFGGDGQGNYGLHFTADLFPDFAGGAGTYDGYPFVGFIPITGLGQFGAAQTACLNPQFLNNAFLGSITASADGRVWSHTIPEGATAFPYPGTGITNQTVVYKSPGPICENYVGPWDFATINLLTFGPFVYSGVYMEPRQYDAQPGNMFWPTGQTIVYDDKRQALYAMTNTNFPDFGSSNGSFTFSQNTKLYFAISRDNGQTWSNPIDIATTDFANRGFHTMALDTAKGNLVFGWYDGRNDPTLTGLQYFGAVMDAKTLDKLVKQIPLSNPIYAIPANPPCPEVTSCASTAPQPQRDEKRIERLSRALQYKSSSV